MQAGCRMGGTNSVPVPHRRPSVSPGVLSAPWPVRGILTARGGDSAAAATVIARPGGRAERPRTWLEGARLRGGNRSLPPTPDRRILSPASPKGPHSRGPTGKRGMEREEREGRGGRTAGRGGEGIGEAGPWW